MSIIKSIKQVLGLGPAAENHFWDGSVANQLTLKRGTPDAPGATVMQVVDGRPSLVANSPVPAFSGNVLAENGAPTAGSTWVARYVRNGGVVTAEVSIYVEGPGTASGGMILNGFPQAKTGVNQRASGSGRHGGTGKMLQCGINQGSGQMVIYLYDNTMIWTQSLLHVSISYLAE